MRTTRQERTATVKVWKNNGIDKSSCGICGQKTLDGTNAAELKIGWMYHTGDASFHNQSDMETDALPIITESGKEEERTLDFLPQDPNT